MMDAGRWELVKRLFEATLGRPAGDRAAFVQTACGADAELRREVESLLAAHADAGRFAEQPPVPATSASVAMDGVPSGEQTLLHSGARIRAYEIRGFVASGGMGDVYRAYDTKLGRDVAIKILPRAFTNNPERLARFAREARVLAVLNHPNIATIHGLEESEGLRALVLELVEGETLAERIRSRPLPPKDAVAIASQIADALDSAHEKGIVHRDLKPANVKVTPTGIVKVLDFGLAKAAGGTAAEAGLQKPAVASAGTREGVILGTPAYMSPEQVRGQEVDKRADIWAFGCVLYEMLTGRAAFSGDTVSDTFVAVLEREPNWSRLPDSTSPAIRQLLHRCLRKDLKERLRDIGDAMSLVEDAMHHPLVLPQARRRTPWVWPSVAVLFIVTSVAVFTALRGEPQGTVTRQQVRFRIQLPEGAVSSPILSPDGRSLALVVTASEAGRNLLLLYSLDSGKWRQLAETGPVGGQPFWSPDSRFIAFCGGHNLQKIDVSGGSAQTLWSDCGGAGTWNTDNVIVFGGSPRGLMKISAFGGGASQLTVLDPSQSDIGHMQPKFLPDGQHFVYVRPALPPSDTGGVYVGSLDAAPEEQNPRRLMPARSLTIHYAASEDPRVGHLLFVREATLFAQPFDSVRLVLTGEAVPIAEQVEERPGPILRAGFFSISQTGVLAFRQSESTNATPVWVDRSGREVAPLVQTSLNRPQNPRLSPDGRRLALIVAGDLWVYDLAGKPPIRLTSDGGHEFPMWTPDGRRLVYATNDRALGLLSVSADITGEAPEPLSPKGYYRPYGWWTDGHEMVVLGYGTFSRTGSDILGLPLGEKGQPRAIVRTPSAEGEGGVSLSPDHRWLAYAADRTGTSEIWVQSYQGPGVPIRVSPNGGHDPVWAKNGRELYYFEGHKLMALAVETGSAFSFKPPMLLFESQYMHPLWETTSYDVAPDGRFLMMKPNNPSADSSWITVVLNWQEDLKRLVPTR